MFGLTHKINDSLLYMTHDMIENILANAEQQLADTPKDKKEDIEQLTQRIAYYKHELGAFENNIAEQRNSFFQFSVEELYYMYGQYDKFVGIEFHKFSDAAKKFGRNIGGIFIYGRKERESLEAAIASGNVPRTNALVKLDAGSVYGLTDEQEKELAEVGFMSGDIYETLATNSPLVNTYTQKGKKEIPNTISIKFDPTGTDPLKMALYTFNLRLNNGGTLIESEWYEYCGYSIYYSPELQEIDFIKEKIFDANGTLKKEARFYFLIAKKVNSDITEDELNEFAALLKDRRLQRFEILKYELKKSNITVEKLKADHPKIYTEIYKAALTFEDGILTYSKSPIPIYWNFKTYLHIYLRHCEELQPDGHFKDKTAFSYSPENIKRVLKIAVEKLQDKIDERLLQGTDFRTYGERALYFNGNYYSMRIESNGRIDSFYPNEQPNDK